uniref:Uncharacterized protein n=1 Tax=Rhizophora mucronata TaxID=61149 RepID=A0A2P2LSK3_RHIMU
MHGLILGQLFCLRHKLNLILEICLHFTNYLSGSLDSKGFNLHFPFFSSSKMF